MFLEIMETKITSAIQIQRKITDTPATRTPFKMSTSRYIIMVELNAVQIKVMAVTISGILPYTTPKYFVICFKNSEITGVNTIVKKNKFSF